MYVDYVMVVICQVNICLLIITIIIEFCPSTECKILLLYSFNHSYRANLFFLIPTDQQCARDYFTYHYILHVESKPKTHVLS
jgi:hypothetical protein